MQIREGKQRQGKIHQRKDVRSSSQLHPILQMQRQFGNRAVMQMMMSANKTITDKQQEHQQVTPSESSRETETNTTTNSNEETKTSEDQNPLHVIQTLQGILKKDDYRKLIKEAQKFCAHGGVGRNLVPPQEIENLYSFLKSKEAVIKPLLFDLIKLTPSANSSVMNLMLELANKVMDGINLVIDGVNKAEANTRVWMLDGNETEIDGVQPRRSMAFDLYSLWEAASAVNPNRKRATLVAPASMRKKNALRNHERRSYAALKNPEK